MKKYLALLLAVFLCLQFAACSGKGEKETESTKKSTDASYFKVSEYGDGISVDGYTGTDADVVIPSEINGKEVLAIGSNAFNEFRKENVLASIDIPDTVKEIGENAFYYCGNLTTVVVGSGVETIGKYAFACAYSVKSFTINGNSLKKISEYAFSHAEGLEYIKLPESVESVGTGAFENAFLLTLGVKDGSYLHTYAKENDIPFIAY
ncbi:MAG: leucine-rich repeat domain-containing protein [Clostridiales bacterium]|nr:leucine-rich repeat domain-containing protein [Clostridiales bacterium]